MPEDTTELLVALRAGDRGALDALIPRVYEELKCIARRHLARERSDHTLNPTALVHEAYMKLVGIERIEWASRAHFLAIASRSMRRLLIDHAAHRKAQKRGGGQSPVPLEQVVVLTQDQTAELLDLEDALERLEAVDGRVVRVVECRCFGGMNVEETAEALGISPATVKRDWTMARAWLNRELSA